MEPNMTRPLEPGEPTPEPNEDPLTYAERALALRRQQVQEEHDQALATYQALKQQYLVATEVLNEKRDALRKIDTVLDHATAMPEFQPVADTEVETFLDWVATVDPDKAAQADVLFRRVNERGAHTTRPPRPVRPVRPERDQ
jgi:hypothetical protein